MTNSQNTPPPSDGAARYFAEQGVGKIEQVQAIVNRAREMLASGEVAPPADGEDPHRPPPYPWELTERLLDEPNRVWLASVDDYATGEGLSVYFAAGFAADEDEFRRSISREVGRELAHLAKVRLGVGELASASMFLSPDLRATLEAFDHGGERPGAMSFIAKYHVNYS